MVSNVPAGLSNARNDERERKIMKSKAIGRDWPQVDSFCLNGSRSMFRPSESVYFKIKVPRRLKMESRRSLSLLIH